MSLTVVLLGVFLLNCSPSASEDLHGKLISSLEWATYFLENEFALSNFDGIVGFSFLRDLAKEKLKKWSSKPELESSYIRVKKLLTRLNSCIGGTFPYLQKDDIQYYKAFRKIMAEDFWTPPDSWEVTDSALVQAFSGSANCYPLDLSDKCIRSILGTFHCSVAGKSYREENGEPCAVCDICKDVFRLGCSSYELSHQIFFIMIAERNGCIDKVATMFGVKIQEYKKIFCSTMMDENRKIAENDFPDGYHDIFAENIMFCGLSGFSDFYHLAWLDKILTWQDPVTGCFKNKSFMHKLPQNTEQVDHQRSRRVKRRERLLEDGCLNHLTSVVVGALAGYLYFL